ncbi:DUF2808 domain-containing protein [Crocosphaera sp. XPORK-15E]|uniref:DUF2808 domain-containing protein n=1 Tax=Crocosphaera sp. XPORK-15E TaxID=3110247 RepID=UPI002B1F8693|nr:DUF2808 domain-containing protein [Crocosphaera sp. XPORK-15E]MEA5535213.1 DUF2808 domain-containing protein [Crocosphaera sp. XPORK-15E]
MGSIVLKYVLGIVSSSVLSVSPLLALEMGNGVTLFNKSPRLVDVSTTLSSIRVRGANYYFTLELPENVDEPLQKLTIQQSQGPDTIYFYLEETFAFEGKPINRGNALTVAEVKRNLDNNKITINFEPPIPPGTTFTIALKPQKNPEISGNYQFGITAYPVGKKAQGLYLGPGRLRFYPHSDRFP